MTSRAGQRLRGGQIRWPDECRRTPAKLPMHAAQTCQSRRMTRLSVRKWRRDRRLKGRDYTPHLWPVWVSLPLALIAALLAGTLIYYFLQGSPLVEGATPLEKTRTAITLAAGIGATLAGLYAYRKQRLEEGSAKRADADQFSARYNSAAEQLGSDAPAVRLAGVYAMARLADDWEDQRQVCIDVLCAYLRMEPSGDSPRHEAEVREAIVGVIASHVRPSAQLAWSRYDFDLHGTNFSSCWTCPARRSPARGPTSPARRSPASRPTSPAPRSPARGPTSPARRSPACWPTSPTRRSRARRPTSPARRSPTRCTDFSHATFSGQEDQTSSTRRSPARGPTSPARRSPAADQLLRRDVLRLADQLLRRDVLQQWSKFSNATFSGTETHFTMRRSPARRPTSPARRSPARRPTSSTDVLWRADRLLRRDVLRRGDRLLRRDVLGERLWT